MKTVQQKGGKAGTTWGDSKKKNVLWTDDESLGGPVNTIYSLFIPPFFVPFSFFFKNCLLVSLGDGFYFLEGKAAF